MTKKQFGIALLVVALILAGFIGYVFYHVFAERTGSFASVAALILVGLAAFIGIMNLLSITSHVMGITDRNQPFGLPEGTVRAILTIAFIVLVGVLASFLLTQTSRDPFSGETIALRQGLTPADAQTLVQQYSADGLVIIIPGTEAGKVDVQFRARHDYRLADDVAKQILTILSTILAAMIGFYFGARPADAAASAAATAANPDTAERAGLLKQLDTLVAQPPTSDSIGAAATTKLTTITDAQKKTQITDIQTKVTAAATKFAAARKTVSDTSQPIETARSAFADGKAAIQDLGSLNQQLGQIT